jgi:hypothetical protein
MFNITGMTKTNYRHVDAAHISTLLLAELFLACTADVSCLPEVSWACYRLHAAQERSFLPCFALNGILWVATP